MALELPRYDKIPLDDKSSHSGSGVANYESITLTEESSSADDVTVSPSTSKKSVLGISLSVITFILCAFGLTNILVYGSIFKLTTSYLSVQFYSRTPPRRKRKQSNFSSGPVPGT